MTDDMATRYLVVVNDEEQYSIWPESIAVPEGWVADGFTGGQADCLKHVEEVWVDLTPRSARGDRMTQVEET